MPGWGKLVVGAMLGAAGTLYATNEEFRRALPGRARDLPVRVRQRFETAIAAAREASATKRAEILHELEAHSGNHARHNILESPQQAAPPEALTTEGPAARTEGI
jgi:hypothetical protein